ncbi:6-pyruvoyl tetrahydropterin synthase family protein, partial [Bacillus velezensis]
VNITVAGDELDDSGFLVNFSVLKKLVHGAYDHTLLNDHDEFSADDDRYSLPTTEVVAKTIYDKVQSYLETLENQPVCVQIFVRETPTSYCVYRPKKGDRNG